MNVIRLLLTVIFIAIACSTIIANNQSRIDSLIDVLETLEEDSNRVKVMGFLYNNLLYLDREKAFYYASQALKLSAKIEWNEGISVASGNVAVYHHITGDYADAIEYYIKSNDYAMMAVAMEKEIAKNFNNMGLIYMKLGEYQKALEVMLNSIDISYLIKDRKVVAGVYRSIGTVYLNLKDYSRAEESYYESFLISKQVGDKWGMAESYNNIGIIYDRKDSLEVALQYYNDALKMKENAALETDEMNNRYKRAIANTINNIGTIFQKQNKLDEALVNYKRALSLYQTVGSESSSAQAYKNIGAIYWGLGDMKKAEIFYRKCEEIATRLNEKKLNSHVYYSLAKLYEQLGYQNMAFDYLKKHVVLQKKFYDEYNEQEVEARHMAFETTKKEREISDLKKDKEINSLELEQKKAEIDKQNLLLLSGAFGLISLIVFWPSPKFWELIV